MKKSKSEITQTIRGQLKYYLSVIEKENDSGIMFNQRVFFLLSAHHIGYISDVKMGESPDQINFEKPKTTVLLTNVKSIVLNAPQVSIKFYLIDGNKKSERTWLLRMETEDLAKAWYDLLQREKIMSTSSKAISPKKPELVEQASPKKPESPQKKKELEIVRPIQLASNVKNTRQFKEIGIGMSPKHAQSKKIQTVKQSPQQKLQSIMKEDPNPRPQSPKLSKNESKPNAQMSKSKSIVIAVPLSPANTTIRSKEAEVSELRSQKSSKIDIKPILVNTKYLNKVPAFEPVKGNDYLQKTHNLIKSIEGDKTNRTKEQAVIITQIKESEHLDKSIINPIKVKEEPQQGDSGLPWTYRYVKYGHLIFNDFQQATQQLMAQLINDQYLSKKTVKFKPKLIKNNIQYFDIQDIEVKLAIIGLEDFDSSMENIEKQRVCNKKSIKLLQNQFNNFKALYEYIKTEQKLKVPLMSLCEYNGFVALFKVCSKQLKKSIRFKEIQYQLSQLQKRSKIHSNFIDSISNVIIQLDQTYYDSLKKQDQQTDFNLYFIQEIEDFLLPDLIADRPDEKILLLRKELLDNYRIDTAPIRRELSLFKQNTNKSNYSKQLQTFSKNILVAITQAILEMDSFRFYFLNSRQFSQYLHSKGINLRYLGHLFENLKTTFQKRFVMTEIAVRSCKALFRKTIQDIIISQEFKQQQDLHYKICDFLNCILGNTFETAAIWKVLSTHAKSYFGFQLNFDLIDRGHFVISLIQNCRLQVIWEKIKPEEAFKSNIFFSQKNLVGLEIKSKSYPPVFHAHYVSTIKILEKEEVYSGFQAIVEQLRLKTEQIPKDLAIIEPQIRRYMSFFVSPAKGQTDFPHLKLYDNEDKTCPSRMRFELLLMRIKWALKLKQRDQYIKVCDYYIRVATKYFGEFHPIYSELYELFSAYHLNNSEYQDAITFAKSSLVNILKICGTGHQKTSECYYHLALCYIKCGKRQEGISHIKKSLGIYENSGKTESVPYAVMQIKLALLYLNQNQVEDCLKHVSNSYSIFQARAAEAECKFQDEITQCLEMLNRCYELLQDRTSAKALFEDCQAKLKHTIKPANLEKLLKIYLSPVLSSLSQVQASNYLDIISQVSVEPSPQNCQTSFRRLRQRISQESFLPNLYIYLQKLSSIEQHIREKSLLSQWQNFAEIYERQTVKDFLAFSVQLLTFLGEGFITGTLREAL